MSEYHAQIRKGCLCRARKRCRDRLNFDPKTRSASSGPDTIRPSSLISSPASAASFPNLKPTQRRSMVQETFSSTGLPCGVWRVGVGPELSLRASDLRISPGLWLRYKALQRREPVVVIAGAVVGLSAVGGRFEFGGERRRPSFQVEMALLGRLHRKREGAWKASQGSANTGPPSSRESERVPGGGLIPIALL